MKAPLILLLACHLTCISLTAATSIVAWGDNTYGQLDIPASATNIVAAAAGGKHSLAVRADGTVIAWGAVTNVPSDATNAVGVAAGANHSLVLRADGTVVAWGSNDWSQVQAPSYATNVVMIRANNNRSVALRADGSVIFWGPYSSPPLLSNCVRVAISSARTMGLTSDGTVFDIEGPLSQKFQHVRDVVSCSLGGYMNGLLLTGDGQVVGTSKKRPVPSFPEPVVEVYSGSDYNLALMADGKVISWGLGPVTNLPASLAKVVDLAPGPSHCLAIVGDGLAPRLLGPAIFKQRAPVTSRVPLFARAVGSQPMTYTWYANDVPIETSNDPCPPVRAVLGAEPIAYRLVVSNDYGSVSTPPVLVTVDPINDWGYALRGPLLDPRRLVKVDAGARHALALLDDGQIVAWGNNRDGQTNVPTAATSVVSVSAGAYHNLALKQDGTVVSWGRNWDGQTNVPAGLSNVIAVEAGAAHSIALRSDGRIVAWGNSQYGQTNTVPSLGNIVAIAAGHYHNLALRSDLSVVAWGLHNEVPASATNIVAIAAGFEHSLGLRTDGTVLAWGKNTYGQTTVPQSATNIVAIAAGWYQSLALRADGTLVTWGRPTPGSTLVPINPELSPHIAGIAAGEDFNLAASSLVTHGPTLPLRSGTVNVGAPLFWYPEVFGPRPLSFQWLRNGVPLAGMTNQFLFIAQAQLSDAGDYELLITDPTGSNLRLTVSVQVNAGPIVAQAVQDRSCLAGTALCLTPTVYGTGPFQYQWLRHGTNLVDTPRVSGTTSRTLCLNPVQYGDEGIYSVRVENASGTSTGAVANVGVVSVMAWGENMSGQTDVPIGMHSVLSIAAGGNHCLALRGDGSVVGWGDTYYGQCAIPPFATNVVAVAAGDSHSLALLKDGTVVGWGDNTFGQTNVPATVTNIVAIAAGIGHSLALKANGVVLAWGLNVPLHGLTAGSIQIAAGAHHSLALRTNGAVVAWGSGTQLQTWVPISAMYDITSIAAGGDHSMALRISRDVVGWGDNVYGQTNIPAAATNIGAIAAGSYHSLAVRKDGTLIGWGRNLEGQSSVPSSAGWLAVAAGSLHSVGLRDSLRIVADPAPQHVFPGAALHFEVKAQGPAPITCQWRRNGTAVPGATSTVLNLAESSQDEGAVYDVIVSNHEGYLVSKPAAVTFRWPLNIVRQPEDMMVFLGTNCLLSVLAEGTEPITYQWFFNSSPLQGETNEWVFFPEIRADQAGEYFVIVTNALRSVTSRVARVTVISPARIAHHPVSQTVINGAQVLLCAQVEGTYPQLQWFKNGSPVESATNACLSWPSVHFIDAGVYHLRATNDAGVVTSLPASVIVLPPGVAPITYECKFVSKGGGTVTLLSGSGPYASNSIVGVIATPDPGWTFLQWLGDLDGSSPTGWMLMNGSKTVEAVFGSTVDTPSVGGGTVYRHPDKVLYAYGSEVNLYPVPGAANRFSTWGHSGSGTSVPFPVSVTSPATTISATFLPLDPGQQTLTILPHGPGTVTLTPALNSYARGQTVNITAMPESGQSFLGWVDGLGGSNPTMTVKMDQSLKATASFTPRPHLSSSAPLAGCKPEGLRLIISSPFADLIDVMRSTNLSSWATVTTLTNRYGRVQFTDPYATNGNSRFYRALPTP